MDDIEKATHLARVIVMQLGMNPKVGLVNLRKNQQTMQEPYPPFSDATAKVRAATHGCIHIYVDAQLSVSSSKCMWVTDVYTRGFKLLLLPLLLWCMYSLWMTKFGS